MASRCIGTGSFQRALTAKHAAFPVLILDTGSIFSRQMQNALQRVAPHLPVSIHADEARPADSVVPQAVILPSSLAFNLPATLREWLAEFKGRRLVVPYETPGWHIVGQMTQTPYQQAAQIVRQWAEGQESRAALPVWQIVLYIWLGLWLLPVLFSLLSLLFSRFFN